MYKRSIELVRKLKEWNNIGKDAPNYKVTVYRKSGDNEFEPFPFVMPHVEKISLDRRFNMAASEFSFTCTNNNGMLSPDYSLSKVYTKAPRLTQSGYAHVMLPYNKATLDLGYGTELVRMFTGQLQPIDISSSSNNITGSAKDEFRKLLKPLDPIKKRVLTFENESAVKIVKDLLDRAGVKNYVIDHSTIDGKDFTIPSVKFELGTNYSDCLTTILDVLGHRCYVDREGFMQIVERTLYSQTDFHVTTIDDYFDATDADYKIDPSVIRNRVIIQSNEGWQAFEDPFLIDYCNGERISCGLESPWATDQDKRWAVADSFFLDMRRKLRRPSIIAKGDPTLDVGDLIKISDLVTTMNAKYMITGIKTEFSSSGYIDNIDFEFCVNGTGHICEVAEGDYEEIDPMIVKPVVAGIREEIVNYALSFQGVYYQWGGDYLANKNNYGFDCSHFTFEVYKKFGLMSSYATAKNQYRNLNPISESEVQPGDLMFYSGGGAGSIHHVAMYLGNGKCISASGGGPSTTSLSKAKASNAYVKIHGWKYMNENYFYARPNGLS